jgi:hypothetical protein
MDSLYCWSLLPSIVFCSSQSSKQKACILLVSGPFPALQSGTACFRVGDYCRSGAKREQRSRTTPKVHEKRKSARHHAQRKTCSNPPSPQSFTKWGRTSLEIWTVRFEIGRLDYRELPITGPVTPDQYPNPTPVVRRGTSWSKVTWKNLKILKFRDFD